MFRVMTAKIVMSWFSVFTTTESAIEEKKENESSKILLILLQALH